MTKRKLAKIINDYIPYWEKPYTEEKDNYKVILQSLNNKNGLIATREYLFDDDLQDNITLNLIISELDKRIACIKE